MMVIHIKTIADAQPHTTWSSRVEQGGKTQLWALRETEWTQIWFLCLPGPENSGPLWTMWGLELLTHVYPSAWSKQIGLGSTRKYPNRLENFCPGLTSASGLSLTHLRCCTTLDIQALKRRVIWGGGGKERFYLAVLRDHSKGWNQT